MPQGENNCQYKGLLLFEDEMTKLIGPCEILMKFL